MNLNDLDFNADDFIDDQETDLPQKTSKNILKQLSIDPDFIDSLRENGYGKLTQVQQETIPVIMTEVDTIILAQTGSGKTLAYLIPLIQKLGHHSTVSGVRGLIVGPTRELASQIAYVLRKTVLFQKSPLRVALLVGGDSLEQQFQALSMNPDIIVATPGRLLFHVQQVKTLSSLLKSVSYFVIDEADQCFEHQLAGQLNDVLDHLSKPQIVMCSATMPNQLSDFSTARLKDPKFVQTNLEQLSDTLNVQTFIVQQAQKPAALVYLLKNIIKVDITQKIIIFVNTRYHCEYIGLLLESFDIKCTSFSGDLDQSGRTQLLYRYKKGEFNLLVATDVAARGLDIQDLDVVINYQFPVNKKIYIHRGGRCARNGNFGIYLNLLSKEELPYLLDANINCCGKIQESIDKYAVVSEFMTLEMLKCGYEGSVLDFFQTLKSTFDEKQDQESIELHKLSSKSLKQWMKNLYDEQYDRLIANFKKDFIGSDVEQSFVNQFQRSQHKIVERLADLSYSGLLQIIQYSIFKRQSISLKKNPFDISGLLGQHALIMQGSLGFLPQQVLDQTDHLLENNQRLGHLVTDGLKSSMQNSLEAVQKQRQSATSASVQRSSPSELADAATCGPKGEGAGGRARAYRRDSKDRGRRRFPRERQRGRAEFKRPGGVVFQESRSGRLAAGQQQAKQELDKGAGHRDRGENVESRAVKDLEHAKGALHREGGDRAGEEQVQGPEADRKGHEREGPVGGKETEAVLRDLEKQVRKRGPARWRRGQGHR